jgi:rod shape determining protein RodA
MRRYLDRPLLFVVLTLALFGLAVLYSSGQTDAPSNAAGKWIGQIVWLGIALVAATLAYRTSFRLLEWGAPWLYAFSIFLLVLTIAGLGGAAGTAASTTSWLKIGGVRLGQPVELAKVAVILMLARWFASRREPPNSLTGLIQPVMIALVPALIVLRQPDLGSAIVFAGILFATLFWAGVSPWLILLLASPVVSLLLAWNTTLWSIWMVALFIVLLVSRPFILEGIAIYLANSAMGVLLMMVWGKMEQYQKDRLLSFMNPEAYRKGPGYQAIQSKVAIGSGGWFGTGYTQGPQKRSGFIPEHWTDFVFAVVGEEFGFLGVAVALSLLFGFLLILVRIARRASDPYASLVVFGVVGLVFTHIFENVGMTVSLMPITGIPLPFFSYGGSFLLGLALCIGFAFRAAGESRASGYVEA